jgi:hypothetical protein
VRTEPSPIHGKPIRYCTACGASWDVPEKEEPPAHDPGRPHLINGEFQSDKYPTCPRGKVPLSCKDPTAQDLLWEYAQRRRAVDAEFGDDLEEALRLAGYVPPKKEEPAGPSDEDIPIPNHVHVHERYRPVWRNGFCDGYRAGRAQWELDASDEASGDDEEPELLRAHRIAWELEIKKSTPPFNAAMLGAQEGFRAGRASLADELAKLRKLHEGTGVALDHWRKEAMDSQQAHASTLDDLSEAKKELSAKDQRIAELQVLLSARDEMIQQQAGALEEKYARIAELESAPECGATNPFFPSEACALPKGHGGTRHVPKNQMAERIAELEAKNAELEKRVAAAIPDALRPKA